jgi:pimeloyl-ACP methyl ester carboxylesterase
MQHEAVTIALDEILALDGDLSVPAGAAGVILFAHGSGSSRHSPRNQHVAAILRRAGLATLLVDLLTADEERVDRELPQYRFDIGQLATRLVEVTRWLGRVPDTAALPIGLFGASTGAAAALVCAAREPGRVAAVVSRGGRPDLAGMALAAVRAPTLFIVGGDDRPVLALHRRAIAGLRAETALEIVPGAGHLFEEPGALDKVARLAVAWFERYLLEPRRAWPPAASR